MMNRKPSAAGAMSHGGRNPTTGRLTGVFVFEPGSEHIDDWRFCSRSASCSLTDVFLLLLLLLLLLLPPSVNE